MESPASGCDSDRHDNDELLPSAARSPTPPRAARLRWSAALLVAVLCALFVALLAGARVSRWRALTWRGTTTLLMDGPIEREFHALGSWYLPSGRRLEIARNASGSSREHQYKYKLTFGGSSYPVLDYGASWFQTDRRFCGGLALFTNETIQCADGSVFQGHQLDTKCHSWPAPWNGESFEENCMDGNYHQVGGAFQYLFNAKRGTPEAVCGQAAECLCCRYPVSKIRLPMSLLNPEQAKHFSFSLVVAMDAAQTKLVAAGKKQLLFAMFTKELVEITRNFLCSVSSWLSGSSTGLIIVAVEHPCSVIEATAGLSPDILCVEVNSKVKPPSKHHAVVYESSRYLFMVSLKLMLWNLALKVATFRGGTAWLAISDVDVVIKEDPFEFVRSHKNFVADARKKSHETHGLMFCMRDSFLEGWQGHIRNTGFCFLEPTWRSVELLDEAMYQLKKGNTYDGTDQGAINYLVKKKRATVAMLPWRHYSNGLLYFGLKMAEHPTLIHANWINNSAMKAQCFKLSGNWYANVDSCRTTIPAVKFVTSSPNKVTRKAKIKLHHGVNVSLDQYQPVSCTAVP